MGSTVPPGDSGPPNKPLDAAAAIGLVYEDLRAVAAGYLRNEASGATLQPTMIVHEAYARLSQQVRAVYCNPEHFRAVACTVMRRVLVDHAKSKQAAKRGGSMARIQLDAELAPTRELEQVRILAVHDAIEKLGRHDQRAARLVELRFFAGFTIDRAAAVLGVSPRQADDDWRYARAWLARELGAGPALSRPD